MEPIGLIKIELPEITMVLSYASRTEDYIFFSHTESDGLNNKKTFDII
tara:strand:+ start:162 stop:305 length:144 start_codon:yes stop_codon:yes gene_type:complete